MFGCQVKDEKLSIGLFFVPSQLSYNWKTYFTNQVSLYLWTMLFCFIHEIGHLTMGLILGLKPEKIEMTPFGFFLELFFLPLSLII